MRAWIPIALVLACLALPALAEPKESALAVARRTSDYTELAVIQSRLVESARTAPQSFRAQIDAAEGLLAGADRLRNERKIRSDLPDDEAQGYREKQAEWAEQALPYAERGLELAADDAERAEAERVIGELHAHRITGMISGMINGPRARRHLGRALELAPDDPECRRAIGLMYLNNPPISGGDVPRAIETFSRCAEEIPDERCLVLLSMAQRKNGDPAAAREAALAALERNADSRDAQLLLEEIH